MWRYAGPSCPDFADAEVDTWVQRILALGVNLHSRFGPIPLRDGVASPWVSPLGPISA
jgi:hypothetical protein